MKISVDIDDDLLEKAEKFGLNVPLFFRNRLAEIVGDGIGGMGIPKYSENDTAFITWLDNRKLSQRYRRDIILYLEKNLIKDITGIPEMVKLINRKPPYFCIPLRIYLNFLIETGKMGEAEGRKYFRVIPNRKINADSFIPNDEQILSAYQKIRGSAHNLYFRIALFSGLRLTEIAKILNEFDPEKIVKINEEYSRYSLNWKRGKKNSFSMFLPDKIMREIEQVNITTAEIAGEIRASGIGGKYLRKYLYNFLIYNGVSEGVADFIEGRSPQSIGSMHYLSGLRQSETAYANVIPKYCLGMIRSDIRASGFQ